MTSYQREQSIPIEFGRYKSPDVLKSRISSKHGQRSPSSYFYTTQYIPWHRPFSYRSRSSTDFSEGDDWFEQMRKRFDERRRLWNDDIRQMRHEFFTPSTNQILDSPEPILPGESSSRPFSHRICWNADGTRIFTADFDVNNFDPQQIHVSIRDDEVIVKGEAGGLTSNGRNSRLITRSINLPEGADADSAKALLTTDGILTFSCPLPPAQYHQDRSTYLTPESIHSQTLPGSYRRSQTLNIPNLDVISRSSERKSHMFQPQFHIEMVLGTDYSPTEIQIRTLNRRIYITARHEERQSNRTAVREFSKEYDLPDSVNPERLDARFEDGILHIETV